MMRPARTTGVVVLLLVLAGSLFCTLCRFLGVANAVVATGAAFAPYALPGFALCLIGLALLHRGRPIPRLRWLALPALIGLLLQVWWQAPVFVGPTSPAKPNFTVLELSTNHGQASPADIGAEVRRYRPQLLVLTETTPQLYVALAAARVIGEGSSLPYLGGWPRPNGSGTIAMSAYPVTGGQALNIITGAHVMRIQGPTSFSLLALHTTQPLFSARAWDDQLALLQSVAARMSGPRLMVGDFNATTDHVQFRRLLDTGLRDAVDQANSGWRPTYSASFPLVRIDHVLVGGGGGHGFEVISTDNFRVAGSDHRGLVARLRLH